MKTQSQTKTVTKVVSERQIKKSNTGRPPRLINYLNISDFI